MLSREPFSDLRGHPGDSAQSSKVRTSILFKSAPNLPPGSIRVSHRTTDLETDVLTDLLEDLAREAPTGGTPPGQLWRRGRRMARTRRVGTVAIAAVACLVLIALGSVTWQQRAVEPPVTDTETKTYVPARIYRPSPYLPGTDDQGPPGVLIATIQAERKGWADRGFGLVGVSATTGDYRFLDLPDAHPEYLGDAALSPDGRYVAYWITGSVPDPLPERPKVPSSNAFSDVPPIVGHAVYDTVTGKVERMMQSTQHGLDGRALVWFDPTHLGVEIGQMRDCCSSADAGSSVFDLATGQAVAIAATLAGASTNAAGSIVAGIESTLVIETDGSTTPANVPQTAGRINRTQFLALSHDAKRIAAIFGNGAETPVYVKDLDADDHGYGDPIPGSYVGVFCWLDEFHLAALKRHGEDARGDLVAIDIRDGSTTRLSEYVDNANLALNLLSSPVKNQPAPPRPRSPWVPTIAAGTTVVAAALAIFVWRRRAGA
ncbi:hypothetical protein ACWZJV_05045 [Nocardioides sp. WG-D5]